jgi:hypothetical protein
MIDKKFKKVVLDVTIDLIIAGLMSSISNLIYPNIASDILTLVSLYVAAEKIAELRKEIREDELSW